MSAKTHKTAGVILSNVVDGHFEAFALYPPDCVITFTLTHSWTVKLQGNDTRLYLTSQSANSPVMA